jgi:hypothetical protein
MIYALVFGLGVWTCLLLGRRMLLALAPIAAGVGLTAVVTLFAVWAGNDPADLFEVDATLRYPLGYRNANAAFFIAGVFPMLVLCASRDIDWRLRGALAGTATLCLQLAVLSQSRGSVFAAILGAGLLLALHPQRARVLAWLGLPALATLVSLPWLLDVYQLGAGNTDASLDPLHTAGAVMALTAVAATAAGCLLARSEPEPISSPGASRLVGRALLGVLALGAVIGAVSLATADGGPFGFISDHADELTAGTPDDLTAQGSRFGLDLRSNRGDLWRVAIDEFEAKPVAGGGAGAFRFGYLLDRNASAVQPEDPHSVELLMAGELGAVGLLLFLGFVGGSIVAVLAARRLGPSAAALAAGSLAVGGYWLAQASVEWFWSYPALTMPVAFAMGVAAAPALLHPGTEPRRRPRRLVAAAAAAVVALALLPLLASERYTNDALETWHDDLEHAYSELNSAADLNPLSDRPLVTEAVIAEAAGEPQRALAALSEAQQRVPDEWTLYYLEARVLAGFDPAGAADALDRAQELNPQGAEIEALRAEVEAP